MLALTLCIVGAGKLKADNLTLNQLEAANGTTSDWISTLPASYPVDVLDATIFGSDANYQTTNANVNNYDYIYFEVTNFSAERAVRVFFWDPNQNTRINYFLKPVAEKETADYAAETTVAANGTYCVKIPDGARLQGAKTPWTQNGATNPYFKFSEIYLTERATPYVELVPYTLVYSEGKAIIPISESHIRTTGNVSINYSTGEVTNAGSGSLIIYLNNEDLVGATLYHADTEGSLDPTLQVTDAVNGEVGGIYTSRYNWSISTDGSRKDKVGAVTALKYDFSTTGNMTFKSIYILADQLIAETMQKDLTSMPYGRWTAPANSISKYVAVDSYKTNNIDGAAHDDVLYGHDGNGDAYKYVDLTNCSKVIFSGFSSNGVIRLFYNWSGTDADKPIEIINDFPKTDGTYVFDIDAFKKAKGITFFHLNGIKSQWAPVTLSEVKVEEYTNEITGSGINRAKNYLANPYITTIDATGLTNSSAIELTSANPNCLFVANAGKLSNDKNVVVDGTCANLVLTDGKPFALPTSVTATAASYTRTMPNTFGSICLPFAVSSDESVQFYTTNGVSGGALVLNEVNSIAAGTPAIVFAEGKSLSIEGSGTLAVAGEADGDVKLTGSYTEQVINVTEDASKNYYGIANNEFTKATNTLTVKPFRAYLTTPASSPAKLRLGLADDEASAISVLTAEDATVKAIYNAAGAKQQRLQKGLNIVKMSNGTTTKVFVK